VDYGAIDPVGLVEPTYLDTDMLYTFLAALEDGVAFTKRENRRSTTERARGVQAGFKVPLLSDLKLGAQRGDKLGETTELAQERAHTASSLFVKLRMSLVYDNDAVRTITSVDDAVSLEPGNLVEITGALTVDPLITVLEAFAGSGQLVEEASKLKVLSHWIDAQFAAQGGDWMKKLTPGFSAPSQGQGAAGQRQGQGRQSTTTKPQFSLSESLVQGARILDSVRTKVYEGPVADYVMSVPSSPLKVVLPLTRRCMISGRGEQMEGGYFTVLGKVTRTLSGDEVINLIRRSTFGFLPREWIERAYDYMRGSAWNLGLPDLIVKAPALQLMPMAVFV
jgi:hypothetical protein